MTATPIGAFYLDRQREMDKSYGKAVVMVEIGKFYEIYTFETKDGEVGRARDVSRTCNIILTRKNKNLPPSMSNPWMCGFPSHSLTRYVSRLVDQGYTVAVYEQRGGCDDKKITRELRGVFSPSMMIGLEEDDQDAMMEERSILVARTERTDQDTVIVQLVCVNTSNGSVVCVEDAVGAGEVVSFLKKNADLFRPAEVLVEGAECSEVWPASREIQWETRFREIEFQEKVLDGVYPRERAHFSIIEDLGMERHPDLVSLLVCTLLFLQDHHPLAVYRLSRPTMEACSGRLYYSAGALYDLNILGGEKNLLALIDTTATPAGKRLLKRRIFEPVCDADELERRYTEIETFLPLVDDINLKKHLRHHSVDMEAQLRRLQIGSISVAGVLRLLQFIEDMDRLKAPVKDRVYRGVGVDATAMLDVMWDQHLLQSWRSWETDGVWRATPPEILDLERVWLEEEKKIKEWIASTWGSDMIARLVYTDDEAFFQVTKKVWKEIEGKGGRGRVMSSGVRVHHDSLDAFFLRRRQLLGRLSSLRKKVFGEEVRRWISDNEEVMRSVFDACARLDVILSSARCARTYRLCRPRPIKGGEEETQLQFKALRHLIVEVASPSTRFVPNDLDLTRILLFGQNSAGKSTLMKSAGVAVVMAQAGMYVPAQSMEWTPIQSLLTKIGSRDNIWKGHSTFITEMSELRHILDRVDRRSLVLCDELTSGTETFSATGIVASALDALLHKYSLFIMTTHLHTLKTFTDLMENPRLSVMHLSMEYRPEEKSLVFDRILRPGFGKSIYGLEIAEYLGFSSEFVRRAYAYRARLDSDDTPVVPMKRSRYNRKKWIDRCVRCGTTNNLHTHHIEPQSSATPDGYIGTYPKDALHNLMTLCRVCHDREHHKC